VKEITNMPEGNLTVAFKKSEASQKDLFTIEMNKKEWTIRAKDGNFSL
jgi:hypothetical protein